MNATDRQVGGSHYKDMKIQPWEFIAANGLDFFQGSVISYVCRYPYKGGVDDLRKAQHYIEFLIEHELNKGKPNPDFPWKGAGTSTLNHDKRAEATKE